MQLINKFNEGIRFLLSVIDIFSKYAWVVTQQDKKDTSTVNAFQKILDNSARKPNKIWADKGSEFNNSSFKNGQKIMILKIRIQIRDQIILNIRFIKTLKTKIYKYKALISKNVYIDKLDDIINEYNNTYHRTIKMKPVDV